MAFPTSVNDQITDSTTTPTQGTAENKPFNIAIADIEDGFANAVTNALNNVVQQQQQSMLTLERATAQAVTFILGTDPDRPKESPKQDHDAAKNQQALDKVLTPTPERDPDQKQNVFAYGAAAMTALAQGLDHLNHTMQTNSRNTIQMVAEAKALANSKDN